MTPDENDAAILAWERMSEAIQSFDARLAPAVRREIAEAINRREKRVIQQLLDHKEKLLADIVNALGEGLVLTDIDGTVLFVNPAAEHLLGWPEGELVGLNFHSLVHFLHEDGAPYPHEDCQIASFARRSAAFRSDSEIFVRKDGSRFNVACTATPMLDHGRVVAIITIFTDISNRKKAELELRESREQYRQLSNFLQSVREEERTCIARELHDELGQSLTALKMDVSWIIHRLTEQQGPMLAKADQMLTLIDNTVDSVRRIASNLRPGQLDDLGLAAAVEWLLDEFKARSGIHYTLRLSHDELALDEQLSTTVFRLLQEALTNVARHAKASSIDVALNEDEHVVRLTITDNGVGFNPESQRGSKKSFGLLGMRERVCALAGVFDLTSRPGEGTQLRIQLPKTLTNSQIEKI